MTDAQRQRVRRGAHDRVSVMLFSLAAFLAVFAVLVAELPLSATVPPSHQLLIRRVYRTTVIETVIGARSAPPSVTQSSSSSSPPSVASPAPTTRASRTPG